MCLLSVYLHKASAWSSASQAVLSPAVSFSVASPESCGSCITLQPHITCSHLLWGHIGCLPSPRTYHSLSHNSGSLHLLIFFLERSSPVFPCLVLSLWSFMSQFKCPFIREASSIWDGFSIFHGPSTKKSAFVALSTIYNCFIFLLSFFSMLASWGGGIISLFLIMFYAYHTAWKSTISEYTCDDIYISPLVSESSLSSEFCFWVHDRNDYFRKLESED